MIEIANTASIISGAKMDILRVVSGTASTSRRNGRERMTKWIVTGRQGGIPIMYKCSHCGWQWDKVKGFNYCPNCGSIMYYVAEWEQEEEDE